MVKLGWFTTSILTVLSVAVSALPTAPAFTNDTDFDSFDLDVDSFHLNHLGKRAAPDWYFRILPLGASIVWGLGSTKGNGFRKPLRDQLRFHEFKVNMVGSKVNGDMADNNVEAVRGYRIDQVQDQLLPLAVDYQPNIVLIHAGTNDCDQDHEMDKAKERMSSLLDRIFEKIPDTTVVLSTLIQSRKDTIERHRTNFNEDIRNLVKERAGAGDKVVLADMDVPDRLFFTKADLNAGDDIHPNDRGFKKMATVFYDAIMAAHNAGIISQPKESSKANDEGKDSKTCDKQPGQARGPVKTQLGSGTDDGNYVHTSEYLGVRGPSMSVGKDAAFFFAKLRSRDLDDLLLWKQEGKKFYYQVWDNVGDANWGPNLEDNHSIDVHDDCAPHAVRWADMNGDGLDDFVCIYDDGGLRVGINRGKGNFDEPVDYKSNEGKGIDRVHLVDIDGDGRFDYCVAEDNGDIRCWRNNGQGDLSEYWQPLGIVNEGNDGFQGHGGDRDVQGIRFVDINGDGRSDWMWVNDWGRVWTWINTRGKSKGQEGAGLHPIWREASSSLEGKGPTHLGQSVGGIRDSIRFARAVGETQDFGLLGRHDYIWIEKQYLDSHYDTIKIHVWKNVGWGGTKLKGDGVRYCNMMGHEDGRDDYVWILSKGEMTLYPNEDDKGDGVPWGPSRVIWDPKKDRDIYLDRRDLHLADWNGDGACDIIYVNPKDGGVEVWLNQIKTTGDFNWAKMGDPAPGAELKCKEKRGIGLYDLAVRFADLTGNKKADYLCIEPNGRVTGFLHEDDGGFTKVDQIKFSVGKDRANHRFADVNGDGRADFLWIDKFNGDTHVWYNQGREKRDGSDIGWHPVGKKYDGQGQGPCHHFPDIDGDGRADLHFVDPIDNTAETWFNVCPDAGGDDGDKYGDPELPWAPAKQWRDARCTDQYINDAAADPLSRWAAAGTDQAFWEVANEYKNNRGTFPYFSQYLNSFFNSTDFSYCGDLTQTTQCSRYDCNDADHNRPAHQQLANSMFQLHALMNNLYGSIDGATLEMQSQLTSLTDTFAPGFKDNSEKLARILNAVGLAFGLALGPAFNSWARFGTEAARQNIKDIALATTSWGVTIVKDEYEVPATVQGGLEEVLSSMVGAMHKSVNSLAQKIFLGPDSPDGDDLVKRDESLDQLYRTLSTTALLKPGLAMPSTEKLKESVKKTLTAFTIAHAWDIGVQEHHPVVIKTSEKCGQPIEWPEHDPLLGRDTLEAGEVCIDGNRYHLISAQGNCEPVEGFGCGGYFTELPGLDKLDSNKWNGVTKEDFVRGALESYRVHGNHADTAKYEGPKGIESFIDKDWGAAGTVPIEVCSRQEAVDGFKNTRNGSPKTVCPDKSGV
ncbi:hypothetical protein jhhlp_002708 [Lomentospora prolificans]|uniref:SGNH hydrolase-type esterase domain-containing protein n=1 Tax=Lomentospora prolificans TaxID=41688 RepID=A0A2N3NET8_9PEZI|nr:hypothetical protein jhhlp_002708 [Lomentospora prolificans]